ncbi:hypothetical protein HHJ75_11605 [Mobiluncus mulieris]|uniref:hypothetical protein n=1 Tax=Mobiluncus mulieris TaxID=2052 RepID=UPI0014708187|nr:hypothetical protein [Mobiluncus mulieris]NMX02298.1 hypothetical protein [Mobiluncus mulieris]
MLTPIVADLSEMDALLLHQRARENGKSVGAEAGFIIAAARHEDSVSETGNTWTRQLIDLGQSIGGTDLDIAPREGNITPREGIRIQGISIPDSS